MSSLVDICSKEDILRLLENGATYSDVSHELRYRFPNIRGLSSRTVRRFCNEHHISRGRSHNRISEDELNHLVSVGISEVSFDCYNQSFMFTKGWLKLWTKDNDWVLT